MQNYLPLLTKGKHYTKGKYLPLGYFKNTSYGYIKN
jgi:hypothetical protein